jgi:hypothetical protein
MLLFVLTVALMAGVKTMRAAGSWYVDATNGNDGNSCSAPGTGNACQTIGAAVSKSTSGDTINVAAGTYNEQVTIGISLTFKGAQAGIDARTRSGAESIITYAGGAVLIEADGVVVDGFTIQGANTDPNVDPSAFGVGIWTNPGYSGTNGGYQILNNIIQNNIGGIEADNDPALTGTHPATIQHNLFLNNNLSGAAGGTAIITDFGLNNALIDSNKFSGNSTSMNIEDAPSTQVTISNNQFDAGIDLSATTYSSVTGNKSANSPSPSSIDLYGSDDHITVSGNALLSGQSAIHVENPYAIYGLVENTNITAQTNCIQGNTVAGLEADHSGYTGIITATNNWWGSASGPSGTGPGSGDAVIDPDLVVVFSPFLTSPSSVCPPTPTISINNIPGTGSNPAAGDGGSFTPTYAYAADGNTSVTSNTPGTCTVSGGLVNFVGPGLCTLVAHATATVNYMAATGSLQSFTIGRSTLAISINNIPSGAMYGGSLTPTYAYTGNGTTFVTSSTPWNCIVFDGTVKFVGVGTCTLTAHATATAQDAAATGSPQSFAIGKATATISIKNIPSNVVYGRSFTPTYNYTGNDHPTESVTASGACTVSHSGVVTFTGVGVNACTLTAHATATTDYAAATGSPQSFTIGQATATISINNIPENADKGRSFTPTYHYTGNDSPTKSVTSSTFGTCTVSGSGVVSFVGVGTCTLTAHATATTDYLAATGSPQSFRIK